MQFGDSLLGRGVAAHSAALERLSSKRLPGLHEERLRDRGFFPLTAAEHPLRKRDPLQEGVRAYDMPVAPSEKVPKSPPTI